MGYTLSFYRNYISFIIFHSKKNWFYNFSYIVYLVCYSNNKTFTIFCLTQFLFLLKHFFIFICLLIGYISKFLIKYFKLLFTVFYLLLLLLFIYILLFFPDLFFILFYFNFNDFCILPSYASSSREGGINDGKHFILNNRNDFNIHVVDYFLQYSIWYSNSINDVLLDSVSRHFFSGPYYPYDFNTFFLQSIDHKKNYLIFLEKYKAAGFIYPNNLLWDCDFVDYKLLLQFCKKSELSFEHDVLSLTIDLCEKEYGFSFVTDYLNGTFLAEELFTQKLHYARSECYLKIVNQAFMSIYYDSFRSDINLASDFAGYRYYPSFSSRPFNFLSSFDNFYLNYHIKYNNLNSRQIDAYINTFNRQRHFSNKTDSTFMRDNTIIQRSYYIPRYPLITFIEKEFLDGKPFDQKADYSHLVSVVLEKHMNLRESIIEENSLINRIISNRFNLFKFLWFIFSFLSKLFKW